MTHTIVLNAFFFRPPVASSPYTHASSLFCRCACALSNTGAHRKEASLIVINVHGDRGENIKHGVHFNSVWRAIKFGSIPVQQNEPYICFQLEVFHSVYFALHSMLGNTSSAQKNNTVSSKQQSWCSETCSSSETTK